MNTPSPGVVVSYNVMYGGLVSAVNFANLDPSGRSDLLKTLDTAKNKGEIHSLRRPEDFSETAKLNITGYAVTVTELRTDQLELCVPIHQIASVGYVNEEFCHIVNIKIGEVQNNQSVFDLIVLYCKTKNIAEEICESLGQRFQQVYRETVLAGTGQGASKCRTRTASSPLVEEGRFLQCTTPSRVPSSASECPTNDLANEYIQLLSDSLTNEELREFAELLGRWQDGVLPVRELALKLMELYGPDRKHLLAKLRHLMGTEESEELCDFLRINGIGMSSGNGSGSISRSPNSQRQLSASSSVPRRSVDVEESFV